MAMPAITFFALLNEGIRLVHRDTITASNVALLPYVEESARVEFQTSLEWASTHPDDILRQDVGSADPEQIKKLLGK